MFLERRAVRNLCKSELIAFRDGNLGKSGVIESRDVGKPMELRDAEDLCRNGVFGELGRR